MKDKFLLNNAIVFFGSLLIAGLGYFYYPAMARLVSVDSFGEIQTLVTIFTQSSLVFNAISVVTVVLISSGKNKEQSEAFLSELQRLMIYLVLFLGVLTMILSPLVREYFNFESVWPFVAMVLALLINIPVVFWNSYLQGTENFSGMNRFGVLGAASKLIFAVILVMIGLGSSGAILGLFFGQLLALWYVSKYYELPSLRALFRRRLPDWKILSLELRYTFLVFFVTLAITLLYSGDILIVKHYQEPSVAGAYAGIASIARIIFFLTTPFAIVLLPAINTHLQSRISNLKRAVFLTVFIGSGSCLFFSLFADKVIRLLIGERYLEYSALLPRLSLAILLISIANILFYYLLSLRNIISLYIAAVGLFVFGLLSYTRHNTPATTVDNLLIASGVTVTLLIVLLGLGHRIAGSSTYLKLRQFVK